MKSLPVKLGVILIGLAIFGNAEVWGADWRQRWLGADWKLYGSSSPGDYYYDKKGITSSSKKNIKLWTKVVYSKKGIDDAVKNLGEEFVDLNYHISFEEIDCIEKKIQLLVIVWYTRGDLVISSAHADAHTPWTYIPSGSMYELLYKEVCK